MCLHISSSLSLSNHPWISQNENCILVNSSLPLIRACWHPLILPFWSPQHKYGFPSKHLTSFVTEYLLVLWGVSLPQGGSIYHYSILTGGSLYHGGQNTISHRQAMLQLHLSYQQFYCLLRWTYIRGFTVVKLHVKLRHWWVVSFQRNPWVQLFTHTTIQVNFCL